MNKNKGIHIPPPETFEQWPPEIQEAVTSWDFAIDPAYKGQLPILLVLPLPISANRYWRVNHYGIPHRSQEADSYIHIVRGLCQMAGAEPLSGDVKTTAHIFRDNARRDLNNCTKVLYDALQKFCYEDDNQICDEHHIRDYDLKNPRVVLLVEPTTPADLGKIKRRKSR